MIIFIWSVITVMKVDFLYRQNYVKYCWEVGIDILICVAQSQASFWIPIASKSPIKSAV